MQDSLRGILQEQVRSKTDNVASVAANDCQIVEEVTIKQG